MSTPLKHLVIFALALAGATPAAQARNNEQLIALINAYRASAPRDCPMRPPQQVAPLAAESALARVRIGRGTILESALYSAGYPSEHAEAISLVGSRDEQAAMDAIRVRYCSTLLNPQFTAIGAVRAGDGWQIVLARPSRPIRLGEWQAEGRAILALVNTIRAAGRTCGEQRFDPAPPLAWSEALAYAALAHSRDMVGMKKLTHEGKSGSQVADRAEAEGYRYRTIAENIASGFVTPAEAVDSWLTSPGHCANIMNPFLAEMGAAYDINAARKPGTVYWTQVFGTPK